MSRSFLPLLSLALLTPVLAGAEDLTFGGGVSITSNYLSDGLSETANRPALQTFLEIGQGGFYAGAWASNLHYDDGNRAELDLYGGYRGAAANGLTYDMAYTQHLYDKTRAYSAELSASLGIPVTDKLTMTSEVSYDLGEKSFGGSLTGEYTPVDGWTLSASVGKADPASDPNWGIGISHDLGEQTSIDLQYADTSRTKGLFAVTLNYKFGKGGD